MLKQVSNQAECLWWLPSPALSPASLPGIHNRLSPWREFGGRGAIYRDGKTFPLSVTFSLTVALPLVVNVGSKSQRYLESMTLLPVDIRDIYLSFDSCGYSSNTVYILHYLVIIVVVTPTTTYCYLKH